MKTEAKTSGFMKCECLLEIRAFLPPRLAENEGQRYIVFK